MCVRGGGGSGEQDSVAARRVFCQKEDLGLEWLIRQICYKYISVIRLILSIFRHLLR